MCGLISAETPFVTAENLESFLASDCILVYYFNKFLSLPCFFKALVYNHKSGLFELANGAAHVVSGRIRTALKLSKSLEVTGDPAMFSRTPPDNSYSVSCLDRVQGCLWIKEKRLPFFLQSDYYHEYSKTSPQHDAATTPIPSLEGVLRLAKLLFQQNPSFCCNEKKNHSNRNTRSTSQLLCCSCFKENVKALKVLESISAKQVLSSLESEQTQDILGSLGKLCIGFGNTTAEKQLKFLADKLVNQVLNDAVDLLHGQRLAETSEGVSKSGQQLNSRRDRRDNQHLANKEKARLERKEEAFLNETKREKPAADKNSADTCCYGNRRGLDEFKEFLRGTTGEKLLNLWMDVERLRAMQQNERKNRYLGLMRSWYLRPSSPSCLNVVLLSRWGLTTSPCWTEERLYSVQPLLTEPLLSYWYPRFWMFQCVKDVPNSSCDMGLCPEMCCFCPLLGMQSCTQANDLKYTEVHLSPFPHPAFTQLSLRCQLPFGSGMKTMLKSLFVEFQAGKYFTHFCEQSGNQFWVNAVYFWTDLHHYRQLFNQDGPDPYTVQREAQLLYATYISSSARRCVNVDTEIRKEVYNRLLPAFEDLFHGVEEHALYILVEPWTLLSQRDKESFQQVCVKKEVRHIDSHEYRELQSLYKESEHQRRRVCKLPQLKVEQRKAKFPPSIAPATDLSYNSRAHGSWSRVSPDYRSYRLGSILQHQETGHFLAFLQEHDASIHLMCWLDLHQYRRTSRKKKAVRLEMSSQIAEKYLNKNYFLGADSPATAEQQNDILRLAGGEERLKLEGLSNPVVLEIQEIIRNYIEDTWMPLFLSTKEFSERQKNKKKWQRDERFSQNVHHRSRARKGVWKPEGLWMSCSKEILLFRRALLNPSTSQQFQHFVSLKGDFLENDVRFWVEVQRYKDLCHSHSNLAIIQQKISTIISCFIKSSMPPTLQIDIPPDQAQCILEKRNELGPYIFREAQISVFTELLKFWPEFQALSRTVCKKQLLPLLQEKRANYRSKERRQRRREEEEDERRAKEELERQRSCVREEEDETDKSDNDLEQEEDEIEKSQLRSQRGVLLATQPLLWSYSKYVAGLRREEALLRRQSRLENSFSTNSNSCTDCSIKSASNRLTLDNSTKTFSRHDKGVRPSKRK